MNQKPIYYDGSAHKKISPTSKTEANKSFNLTDEIRLKLSGNPYIVKI